MFKVLFKILIPGREPEDICIVYDCSKEPCERIERRDDTPVLVPVEFDPTMTVSVDGHVCSLFFAAIERPVMAHLFLKCFRKLTRKTGNCLITVKVERPKKAILDQKGNEMFSQSALERRELDNALAWFSTLGGAFSALGDYQTNAAIIAGKISAQQFRLALRLGDPNLQSRCRLFLALSFIQQKKFRLAKKIVKQEYKFATSQIVRDSRLISMCFGIWAKWKYEKSKSNLVNNSCTAISL